MVDNNTNTVINTNTVHMTEKQKVKEITDRLEEGLKELFESEKYKSYLSTMSKFSQVQICVYIHLPAMLVRLCCLYLQEI